MSRLSELYKAIETMRKENISNEKLEQDVCQAEEEIIKNEILPIVSKNIAPVLKQIQRELVLVVDYIPNKDITVHLSRKIHLASEIVDAKEILPDPEVEHGINTIKAKKTDIAPATRLKITFNNGKIIQEQFAADTFRKFIQYIGIQKVRSVGIIRNKIPLISNTLDKKYKKQQKPLGNGWYLMTNTSTKNKKKDIEYIAKQLNIKCKVEII